MLKKGGGCGVEKTVKMKVEIIIERETSIIVTGKIFETYKYLKVSYHYLEGNPACENCKRNWLDFLWMILL